MRFALVTGGSGFLGSHLVAELLKRGRKVRVFDLKAPAYKGAEFVRGDVRDLGALMAAAKGARTIFHLASAVPQDQPDEKTYREVIVAGTENVMKACRRYRLKAVVVSSSSVYGANRDGRLSEDAVKKPYPGYGLSKLEAERVCSGYSKHVNVTVLRPMVIIGSGMRGIFVRFLRFLDLGAPVIMFGSGKNRIQFVAASDCVSAMLKAEKYRKSGEVFNLGSENVPRFRQQLEAIRKHANSSSVIISLPPGPARRLFRMMNAAGLKLLAQEHYEILDKECMLDIRKARRRLKWRPEKGNIQMMKEAYDWHKNQ